MSAIIVHDYESKDRKYVWKWRVESMSSGKEYIVSLKHDGHMECSCPAWKFKSNRKDCKHITEVKHIQGDKICDLNAGIIPGEAIPVKTKPKKRKSKAKPPTPVSSIKGATDLLKENAAWSF